MIPISVRRRVLLLLLLAGGLAQAGCITRWLGLGSEPSVEGSKGDFPLTKLERLVDTFAERQVTLIADACDAIKRDARDSETRRRAHHVKLANATAVYDVVTQPELLGRLADLYVLVELEHIVWVQEGRTARWFEGEGAERLIAAVEEARRGMSFVADLAMKPERRSRFDNLIHRWRTRNPDVEFIAGIRFGALPETAGKSVLENVSSFFDVLNPMDDTRTSVERARLLGDRAFFYSKRLLKLSDWQAEAALEDTLAKPEIRKVLSDVDRAVASADRISGTFRDLPDRLAKERAEIRDTLTEGRELAVQAAEAGRAFEKAFRALHDVTGSPKQKDSAAPPSHPFDVRDYTAAAAEIRKMARESGSLLEAGEAFADRLFWRGIVLVALFFVLLLGYRLVATRFIRPPTRPPPRPPTTWERYGSPT